MPVNTGDKCYMETKGFSYPINIKITSIGIQRTALALLVYLPRMFSRGYKMSLFNFAWFLGQKKGLSVL